MKNLYTFLSVLAVAALMAVPTQAQKLGINAQYGLDYENVQLGGEVHIPIYHTNFSVVPNAEVYLQEDPTIYTVNGDLHYAIGSAYTRLFTPYAGLGVGVTRHTGLDETELGLNVIGGANFHLGVARPFVQLEYRTGTFGDLSAGGGIRFLLQ